MENYLREGQMCLSATSAPVSAAPAVLGFDAADFLPAQHVVAQARPVPALTVVAGNGINGTTGFMGKGIQSSDKRTDVRGAPPRGRPV